MKPRKILSCCEKNVTLHEKNNRIFHHQYQRQVKTCIFLYLLHDWFYFEFVFIYSISLMYKYLPELVKTRSKVQEKNISCECVLSFDQWKSFSQNYKPLNWLWFVYKFTKNNCCLQLFAKFIPTQKRCPISLDKISILTWKLLFISSQNFPCELNSQRAYSLSNISYLSLQL